MSTIRRTQRVYRRCNLKMMTRGSLGKILGTERKMNAVTLGLCMVSGERVGALSCTRLFWACKPRYKTGVSHVGLHWSASAPVAEAHSLVGRAVPLEL